jgi:protease II
MDTTNTKGNKGLVNVIADLVNKDFFVFLPITDTTCVDVVVSNKEMELKKIQVKFRSMSDGVIEISTETIVNGKRIPVNLDNIDLWAIYCPDNKNIYYVSTKDLKSKKILVLRIEPPKQKQKTINYAYDYLDINIAWNK